MTAVAPAPVIDRRSARRSFDRAAAAYDRAAVLQRHVADELLERLGQQAGIQGNVLDLGSGTGYAGRELGRKFPDLKVFCLDNAPGMAFYSGRSIPGSMCGDAEALPIADATMDLVLSNMAIQWCRHEQVFAEVRRVLKPGGLWLFSTVGPDTLWELREAWGKHDRYPRVHGFTDVHDLGDGLLSAGFANPVMDIDRMTMTYPSVIGILRDLKALGVVNAAPDRSRGLLGKRRFEAFQESYEKYRDGQGVLPTTWEIIYGQAWLPEKASVRVEFTI